MLLEIQLKGFKVDFSDFTEDAAITKIDITASVATHDNLEFRIICNVSKETSFNSASQPLAQFFNGKNSSLRERIAPVIKSLKADVTQMLTEWKNWSSQAVRLSPNSDDIAAMQAAEALIYNVLKKHGPKAAVWTSKAVLATLPTVPAAWLETLKSNAEYPKKEYIRIVECAMAACDFAYGPDFNIPQIGDPGLVPAIDTFLVLGQFATAVNKEVMGSSELEEIGLDRKNLNAVLSRRFPKAIMEQSQELKPISS